MSDVVVTNGDGQKLLTRSGRLALGQVALLLINVLVLGGIVRAHIRTDKAHDLALQAEARVSNIERTRFTAVEGGKLEGRLIAVEVLTGAIRDDIVEIKEAILRMEHRERARNE